MKIFFFNQRQDTIIEWVEEKLRFQIIVDMDEDADNVFRRVYQYPADWTLKKCLEYFLPEALFLNDDFTVEEIDDTTTV